MDNQRNIQTVIAPVGLGGKTTPYIADPAPTLLVELASVETERELARIAALLAEAEQSAAMLTEEAAERASAVIEEASTAAAATLRSAEHEAESITSEAEGRRVELDVRAADLDTEAQVLDERRSQLDDLAASLIDRTAAVDAEAADSASILAEARIDAEAILAEASSGADAILAEAREQAKLEAESAAESRSSQETDDALVSRIAEIEGVHRIEVQVLHERETELLAKIGYLESQLQAGKRTEEDVERAPDVAVTDTVSIEIDSLAPRSTESRSNGRHNGDVRGAEYAASGPLATHAPLTEQLSTSAFRASPETDRRGRRRR